MVAGVKMAGIDECSVTLESRASEVLVDLVLYLHVLYPHEMARN